MSTVAEIRSIIEASIAAKTAILTDIDLQHKISQCVDLLVTAFSSGHRVYFCGNGGSAADAQHLAAEFTGRFYKDRAPLPAEALHTNTSYMTAVANDYSYDEVYSRLIKAVGSKGDVLVALSTSGNSTNILMAIDTAKKLGLSVIGFTGLSGGAMKDRCDILINVPSANTPRIQECHIMTGHIICQLVEQKLYP